MTINEPRCVVCGGRQSKIFLEGHDRLQGRLGHFIIHQCLTCNTLFLYPQPSFRELANSYPEDYAPYKPGKTSNVIGRWSLGLGVAKQVRAVTRWVSGSGRALDIGCGGGEFLSELRKQGWSVYGMEINTHIATFAQNQRGIDMIAGDAHELAYAKNTFDLITLWDTLEHFKDPRRALNDAFLVARPSALLVVSTPNPDSLEAQWFGPYWAGWDIPRHLNLFPRSTLTQIIEEEGWSVQEVRYFRGRHWLLAHSLRFWLQDKRLPQILYKFSVAFINSRLMQALSLPFFMVVERLKLGSIMVFFARRKGADHA